MDTPRPTGDRVPLGDLTNTPHGGNHMRPNEQKRQRDRERYATMSDEKSERNKKRREMYKMNNQGHVDSHNNVVIHSTDGNTTNGMDENSDKLHMHSTNINGANELSDGNTTNEMDENSEWLHRQSTYSNDLQQLSDGPVPLSNIGGTGYMDVIKTGSGYAPSPINWLVMCPNERKRDRDGARYAAMSTEQKAL